MLNWEAGILPLNYARSIWRNLKYVSRLFACQPSESAAR
jgi:hypothetical protein